MSNSDKNPDAKITPSQVTAQELGVNLLNLTSAVRVVQMCWHADQVPILVGESGTGKTALIQQLAKINNAECIVYPLSTKEPQDIAGLPFPKDDGTYEFLRDGRIPSMFKPASKDFMAYRLALIANDLDPEKFAKTYPCWTDRFAQLVALGSEDPKTLSSLRKAQVRANLGVEDQNRHVILFFDEINRSSRPVFNAAFSVWNERRFGDHVLGPNVRIVAAQNPSGGDYATAAEFTSDPAMRRRMCWIVMEVEPSEHADYRSGRNGDVGLKTTIPDIEWDIDFSHLPTVPYHDSVLTFLSAEPGSLRDVDAQMAGRVYACPATWEAVSKVCYAAEHIGLDLESPSARLIIQSTCGGLVGHHTMLAFLPHFDRAIKVISPDDVLEEGLELGSSARSKLQRLLDRDDIPSYTNFIEQFAMRLYSLTLKEIGDRDALYYARIVDALISMSPMNITESMLDTMGELANDNPGRDNSDFLARMVQTLAGNTVLKLAPQPGWQTHMRKCMEASKEATTSMDAMNAKT